MRILRVLVFIFALTFIAFPNAAQAIEPQDLNARIFVEVNEDGSSSVRQVITGKQGAGKTVRLPIVPTSAQQVDVKINDQSQQQVTVVSQEVERMGFLDLSQSVELDLPSSGDWRIELTYDDAGVYFDGQEYRDITIPAFINPYAQETIELSLPVSTDLPVSIGVEPETSIVEEGRQTYVFESDGARTQDVLLSYGTDVTYSTTQSYELKNEGWWWKDYQIVLPPDSNQQTVGIESLSRNPRSSRVDQDGNIVLTYRVGPKKTTTITAEINTNVRSLQYQLPQERTEAPGELADYIQRIGKWREGQPLSADTPRGLVDELISRTESGYEAGASSEDAINQLIADARASNIPSRFIRGAVVKNQLVNGQFIPVGTPHVWAEVYFDGAGWLTLDPTFAVRYSSPLLSDALHIAQKVHGVSDVEPESTPAIIQQVAFSAEPITLAALTVNAQKYMILPGFSLVKTTVSTEGGAVQDNIGFSDGGTVTRLGSLAPLQQISTWSTASGSESWTQSEQSVGITDGQIIQEILHTSQAAVYYIGMLASIFVIGGLIFLARKYDGSVEAVKLNEPDEVDDLNPEELLDKSIYARNPVSMDYNQ